MENNDEDQTEISDNKQMGGDGLIYLLNEIMIEIQQEIMHG